MLSSDLRKRVRNAMLLQAESPTLRKVFELAELVELNIVEEQVRAIVPLSRDSSRRTSNSQSQKVSFAKKAASGQQMSSGTKFVPSYAGQSGSSGAYFECGGYGHIARECPKKGQEGSSSRQREVVQCDHCGKQGHAQERCFDLHPELRTQLRQDRQQQKTPVGEGGQQQGGPSKVNVGAASDAKLSAKIELLEKQLAAALAIRGDVSTSQSSDLRADWMMAGAAHVGLVEAGAAVTRGKGKAQEPRGAVVDLDPQRGGGRQTRLPQSFLLSEVVRTPVRAPTPVVSGSASDVGVGPTSDMRGPSSAAVAVSSTMLGATTALCELPLFSATQLRTVGFEAAEFFRLAATLCEGEEGSASSAEVATTKVTVSQGEESKEPCVDMASKDTWHAAAASLVKLPARPAIDRTMVRPNMIAIK